MSGIHWLDAYTFEHDGIVALYEKNKRLHWNATEALDWSAPFDPSRPPLGHQAYPILDLPLVARLSPAQRELLTSHLTAHTFSQFLHGEQGALMVAAKLVQVAPDLEAKLYAASQAADEARHIEAFQRYATRTGQVYPISRRMKVILDGILSADHWIKVMIGMQIIIEGMALASFHNYLDSASDPLARTMLEYVLRDEARHVGFGHLYAKATLAAMHADDREDVAEFAFRMTRDVKIMNFAVLQDVAPVLVLAGIDLADVLREFKAAPDVASLHARRGAKVDPIEACIIPSLGRIGALTARARQLFSSSRFDVEQQFFLDPT